MRQIPETPRYPLFLFCFHLLKQVPLAPDNSKPEGEALDELKVVTLLDILVTLCALLVIGRVLFDTLLLYHILALVPYRLDLLVYPLH